MRRYRLRRGASGRKGEGLQLKLEKPLTRALRMKDYRDRHWKRPFQ